MSTPSGEMFVDFQLYVANNIGNTPYVIFESDNVCVLQSIKFVNLTSNPIKVFAYLLRDMGGGVTQQSTYCPGVEIEPLGRVDILEKSLENIQPTDKLYAYSDYSSNKFNSFISYQALLEI